MSSSFKKEHLIFLHSINKYKKDAWHKKPILDHLYNS